MEKMTDEDRRLAALIRAASPQRSTPAGLQTRIMAQVRLRERRRRERQTIVETGCYCLGLSVLLLAVGLLGVRSIGPQFDLPESIPSLLYLFCGITGIGLTLFGDRMDKVWRRS